MTCTAAALFDAIGDDPVADGPLDLVLSPEDLLRQSSTGDRRACAPEAARAAAITGCAWDRAGSRGDFELICVSDQLFFLIGNMETFEALRYQIDANGWTYFAFVLSFSTESSPGADQRPPRYLQIGHGRSDPRACPGPSKWAGVMCLLKDHTHALADDRWLPTPSHAAGADEIFFMPPTLAKTAMSVILSRQTEPSRTLYRTAKCLELLDLTLERCRCGDLLTMNQPSSLSLADAQRLNEARRIIVERYSQPLTLDFIARSCGLNRAKLTRGFKEIFNCTIGEMLAEQRLRFAATSLTLGDDPVSRIAFSAGYLSNASFARAFNRRFGSSPSRFRQDARTACESNLPAPCKA